MSSQARFVGLLLALAMGVFSAWMYLKTGDWVAAVFLLGSMGYGVFFFSTRKGSDSNGR